MLTKSLFTSLTKGSSTAVLKNVQINNYVRLSVNVQKVRHLYSKTSLGIDTFLQQCQVTQKQMENITDKFKAKMHLIDEEDNNYMVFSEDLKNMIHITTDVKDVELVVKMIKKFNIQNKQMRFGNFVFGPIVMRLFHHYNTPELALECFKSEELKGFFDQIISYQILLDLLFENKQFQEILNCVELIKQKQLEGMKYPRNVVVLALAACYKLNSKESWEHASKLWQELQETGHFPMRRATTFCAGLAYNQGNPGIALEILTTAKNQNYTTVRNLKVACLAAVGRVENIIPLLKSILSEDVPGGIRHTFNQEVLNKVKESVALLDNPEIALEFNRIEQMLQKQGQIVDTTIDEQLCKEIQPTGMMRQKNENRFQSRYMKSNNEQKTYTTKKYYTFNQRPGLNEMV